MRGSDQGAWADRPYRSERLRVLQQRVRGALEARELRRAAAAGAEAWEALPPAGIFDQGPYLIGHTPDGAPVCLRDEELNGPITLLVGPPNSGKSFLLERLMHMLSLRGLLVIGVDTKNAGGVMPRHGLPVLEPSEAAFGCGAPPGASEEEFDGAMLTLVEQQLYVYSGTRYILECIQKLRQERAGGRQPCLRQVLEVLTEHAGTLKPWSKSAAHVESAVAALRRLCGSTALFSAVRPLSWEKRFTQGHVLRLRGQPAEAIRVAVLTYMHAFLCYAGVRGWTQRQLRAVFCLDDARVVARGVNRDGQVAVDGLTHFADVAHASGGAAVTVVQNLCEVSHALVNSANAVILVGPIASEDLRQLRTRLRLTPEREEWLLHQPAFHATLHVRAHAWPHPVPLLLAGPAFAVDALEAQQRRVRARRLLLDGEAIELYSPEASPESSPNQSPSRTSAPATPPVAAAVDAETAPVLPAGHHRLMTLALDRPSLLQSELGEAAGIAGRELTTLREELQQWGLVITHRLVRYSLWEATAEGARRIGRVYTPLGGRGDYPHRFLQERWRAWVSASGGRAYVEHLVPGVGPVDGYAESASGVRSALEIVLAPETLPRSVEKLRGFTGEKTLVVRDRAAADALAEHTLLLQGITILTVQDLVARTAPVLHPAGAAVQRGRGST